MTSTKKFIQDFVGGILIIMLAIRSVLSCEFIAVDYVLLIVTPVHFIWTQLTR